MFDAVLSFNLVEHLAGAAIPGGRAGYSRIMSPHRGPHQTSDGYVAIMPYTDANWESLFRAIDRLDVLERPWFANYETRTREADRVFGDLAEIVAERTTEEWLEICERLDIPVSAVSSLDDVVNDEKLNRGVITTATHPVVGEYREIAPPVAMSKTPASIRRPAPLVAQDTREILDELGYSSDEVTSLIDRGVAGVSNERSSPDVA